MADAHIRAVITAKDEASGVLSKFGSTAGGAVKAIGAGLAIAGVAVAAFGIASVKAFSESENVASQLGAVLKSTGGVAGVTADAATKLASSLQGLTKFSDEQILSGENLLLTFTSIGKDIFPQATETMLNMSQALGQDTKNSAIQLGKALNDPIRGVTSLRRVGVQFSTAQEEVIRKLVESGKKAEAQKIILQELQTEFGGSAQAAGKTFAGQLIILKNTFGDAMEVIGKGIVDAILPFAKAISSFVASDKFKAWLESATKFMASFFSTLAKAVTAAMPTLITIFRTLKDVGVATWEAIIKAINFLMPSLQALWLTIQTQLWPALKNFWDHGGKVLAQGLGIVLVGAIYVVINVLNFFIKIWSFVLNAVSAVYTFITVTLPTGLAAAFQFIIDKAIFVKDHFWTIVGQVIGFFATLPIKLPIMVALAFAKIISLILSIKWGAVFSAIGHAFGALWDGVKNAAIGAFNFIKGINWGEVLVNIGKGIANSVIDLINGAFKGAMSGVPLLKDHVPQIPHFAQGVTNFAGGMAIVGERGPELVQLPRGSNVLPNGQGAGSTINISLNGPFMGTGVEARSYAQSIIDNMKDIANSKNMSVAELLK